MRTLNETDAFMEAKERYRFEGTKRYDIEKLDAFLDGFEFADKQIKPMFILFCEFYKKKHMEESDAIMKDIVSPNGDWQNLRKFSTTTELFELWLEERQQKPIHQQIIDTVGGEEAFCELSGIKQTKK